MLTPIEVKRAMEQDRYRREPLLMVSIHVSRQADRRLPWSS
jgi:hypothetical protein